MASLRIELAGSARILVGPRVLAERDLGGAVNRRVLAVLALESRPVTYDELGDAVWGEALPKTWTTALRGAVRQLRQAVAGEDPDASEFIRTAFGCYQLDPDAVVDVVQAVADVEDAEGFLGDGDPATAGRLAERASEVLARPLLAGLEGEWLEGERRRLAPLHTRALLAASAAATAMGDHRRSVAAASAAIDLEPLAEGTHRRLMAAHAAAGDRTAALLAYRRCREVLADELGLEPSDQTEVAHRSVLAGATPVPPVALPPSLDTGLAIAGRDPELSVLRRRWDVVAAGGTGAVALVGAAGVGKSRLAAEVAVLAHARGGHVILGRFDPEDLTAFGAFAEVFGQLGVAWPPPDLLGGAGGAADRSVLFDAAASLLTAAAARGGLVVILDDVHWADRPSLALLGHLVAARIAGLLLVATSRDDWVQPALAELLEQADRLDVGPLDAEGIGDLVHAWAGQRPEPELVARVGERTGGNPFFVTAMLQDLAARGGVALATGIAGSDDVIDAVPGTVLELVRAAVERCGADAQDITDAAAILRDGFRSDDVATISDHPVGATLATLERLVHVRVLGQVPNEPGRFRFSHALVRESLLEQLDAGRQRELHRKAAAALDAAARGSGDVLRHLLAAGDASSLTRTVELALEAANELVDGGAADEAARILGQLGAAIDEAGGVSRRVEGSVCAARAMAALAMDDLETGREHLRQAARIGVELGDPSVLLTGSNALRPPAFGEVDLEMLGLVDQLLALTRAGSRLRSLLLCWQSVELGAQDAERSAATGREALAIARELQEPVLLRQAILVWHLVDRAFAPALLRRAALEELLGLRSTLGKRTGDLTARVFLVGDCLELGDHPAATAAAAAVLEGTTGFGPSHLRWLALRNTVLLRAMEGNLDEAEAGGVAAGEVAIALALPEAMTLQMLQLLVTRYHQGRLDELHPMVAAVAGSDLGVASPVRIVLGWMEAELDRDSAPTTVETSVSDALAQPRLVAWVGLVAIACEAAAKVGNPRTPELAALLEPLSGQHVVIVTIGYLGAVDRYLGLAAAAAGDTDRARSLLQSALDQHRAIGSRPYVERTETELAALGPCPT